MLHKYNNGGEKLEEDTSPLSVGPGGVLEGLLTDSSLVLFEPRGEAS